MQPRRRPRCYGYLARNRPDGGHPPHPEIDRNAGTEAPPPPSEDAPCDDSAEAIPGGVGSPKLPVEEMGEVGCLL